MLPMTTSGHFDDYVNEADSDDFAIDEYDLSATPNDFNVATIYSFIEAGAVRVPEFQRSFVWDIKRSSKLIESLILGLPVPQVYLYEESRNQYSIMDGQQRLMSIFYFRKERFPRRDKRAELRTILDSSGAIPESVWMDDSYFMTFRLALPAPAPNKKSRFAGLTYSALGEYQRQLDLRPLRNVIIKQNSPKGDRSSVYEIFNRLNTGGVNLRPQEIRSSIYHSDFYEMLYRINTLPAWRRLVNSPSPDLHRKDVEVLLRGFAFLINSDNYSGSISRFLGQFSSESMLFDDKKNEQLEELFHSFLVSCEQLPQDIFLNRHNKRFNLALYEAVFVAACLEPIKHNHTLVAPLTVGAIRDLGEDSQFLEASLQGTAHTSSVKTRLERAKHFIGTH